MIIDCSSCGKSHKVLETQVPKGKALNFICKGCSTKLIVTIPKTLPGVSGIS